MPRKSAPKSQQILAYLQENPGATSGELVQHFARKKINVVSSEISTARKKLGLSRAAAGRSNGKPDKPHRELEVSVDLESMTALRDAVAYFGDFDSTLDVLNTLADPVNGLGGINQTIDAVETLRSLQLEGAKK